MANYKYWKMQTTKSSSDAARCSDCGGLKCLCRPRFFAGQLLSEEDLNRLDCYIIEKHKLHNRHLHGWGVACGLEVRCDPCEDRVVTVSPGYALSPCGEDIVVCEKDTVPVCELVKECRERERSQDPCRPYGYSPDCPDEEEDWVLAIRYDEHPERGITALRHVDSCCHSSDAKRLKRRDAPAQCEPTMVCETYRYEVFRALDQDPSGGKEWWKIGGVMVERAQACFQALMAELPDLPEEDHRMIDNDTSSEAGDNSVTLDSVTGIAAGHILLVGPSDNREAMKVADGGVDVFSRTVTFTANLVNNHSGGEPVVVLDPNAVYRLCCEVKRGLGRFFLSYPGFNCQYRRELDCIVCPDPNQEATSFAQARIEAVVSIATIVVEAVFDCLCSAMLPPCTEPTNDARVPLALITIRNGDCRILQVCNWTVHRKFLTTFPNLQYWLSWMPFGRLLREYLQLMCCEHLGLFGELGYRAAPRLAAETSAPFKTKFSASDLKEFSKFFTMTFKAFARAPLDADALFRGVMGKKDAQGRPILNALERANLPQFLLINQLARPLAAGVLPEQANELFKNLGEMLTFAPAREEEIKTLKSQVQEMEKKLKTQEENMKKVNAILKKRK